MKRHFYYLECETQPKLFKYLNSQVAEGYITYHKNESTGMLIIDNLELEDDDEMFVKLEKMDLIEDFDCDDYEDDQDDYNDFYSPDDYEDN